MSVAQVMAGSELESQPASVSQVVQANIVQLRIEHPFSRIACSFDDVYHMDRSDAARYPPAARPW